MDARDIGELYDRQAARYDAGELPLELLVLRRLRARLLEAAEGRVLEVGIGSGASLPYYPPGCAVTGLDASAGMLERARARADRLGRDVDLRRGDAEHLLFPDGAFDTGVSQLSLCTVPDPVAALGELRRVCRPGGRILLLEHTTSTNRLVAPLCRRLGPVQTRTMACDPNRPILGLVERAGLAVERTERHTLGIVVLVWARP